MNFIKNLLKTVCVMFIILFFTFAIYIKKDVAIIEKKPEIIETNLDETKIQSNTNTLKEEKQEEQEIIINEPHEPQVIETNKENIVTYDEEINEQNNGFYYTNLDTYSKLIYNGLQNSKTKLIDGNAKIVLDKKLGEALEANNNVEYIFSAAVEAFENDNPDLFYIDFSKMILYYEKNTFGNYSIYLKNGEQYSNYYLDSFNSKEEILLAQEKIDEITNTILSATNNMNNSYDKILFVHDWLTSNLKYDETINRANKDTIYGAFIEKEVVCGGYAKSFKYLMDKIGINTIIILRNRNKFKWARKPCLELCSIK